MYPGYCYECGKYVPTGYGHFEFNYKWRKAPKNGGGPRWRVKCVECASGRKVHCTDYEVINAREAAKERKNK